MRKITTIKMFRHTLVCLQVTLLFPFFSLAQIPVAQWIAKDGSSIVNSVDIAYDIAIDKVGNSYVTGKTRRNNLYVFGTIKYNSNGIKQWDTAYTGSSTGGEAHFIRVDDSGNVYITGQNYGVGTGYDYCTIKYNSSGIPQWISRYNWNDNLDDIPTGMKIDKRGNVYVTGYSLDSNTSYDYATVKYNSNGIATWIKRYNGSGNNADYSNGIDVDDSGYVYVTGSFYISGNDDNIGTIKYDSSGTIKWVKEFEGPAFDFDQGVKIVAGDSGYVYVTGICTRTLFPRNEDYVTIKYNSLGDSLWVKRYDNGNDDEPTFLTSDKRGNVYVTGWSRPVPNPDSSNYATVKYSSSGVLQWDKKFNIPGNHYGIPNSMVLDTSGNIYVTGSSRPSSTTNGDYATVKYDSSGIQKWFVTYNGSGNGYDEAYSIAADTLGNIYVTGKGFEGSSYLQYVTIKYSQTTGISELNNDFSILVYPNPFSDKTQIEIISGYSKLVNPYLKIFDLLGNEMREISLQSNHFEIQRDNLPSGLYFYSIISSNKIFANGKMIIN